MDREPTVPVGPLAGALVVVAHPDDEILWLAPAVAQAAMIVAALPGHAHEPSITQGREAVRIAYPVGPFEFLPLVSAGVYKRSDWLRRVPAEHGVTLKPDCPVATASRYRDNYSALVELLEPYVKQYPVVYTHNPWGEYGHEEHVQVSNAILALAQRHGCSVWAWDGFPERRLWGQGMRLRTDYFTGRTATLPRRQLDVDSPLYRQVRELYIANGAWTWDQGYDPPPVSSYLQLAREGEVLITPRDRPEWARPLGIAAYGSLEAGRQGRALWARAAREGRRLLSGATALKH